MPGLSKPLVTHIHKSNTLKICSKSEHLIWVKSTQLLKLMGNHRLLKFQVVNYVLQTFKHVEDWIIPNVPSFNASDICLKLDVNDSKYAILPVGAFPQ